MLVPATTAATAFVSTTAAASSTLIPSLVNLCSQLAPTTSVLLCAAPLPTIAEIKSSQTVGQLPLLPYSCMAANNVLWTVYGALQQQATIWIPNAAGILLALYFLKSFIKFAPRKAPTLPGSVKQHVGAVLGVTAGAVTAAVSPFIKTEYIGTAAVLFCIALFASPLASIKTVIQNKSARSIPLPFTVMAIANTLFWSVTGIVKLKDFNVIVPNVLGLFFGLIQVSLKLIYGDGPAEESKGYALASP